MEDQVKISNEEIKSDVVTTKSDEVISTKSTNDIVAFSPSQLLAVAINQGFDLQRLEKLIELQERWEANEARKAYHNAMAQFKQDPPQIYKDMVATVPTQKGTFKYNYASLGNVVGKLNEALAKHGFSSKWDTAQKDGKLIITNIITHQLGHSEKVTLELPYDTTGFKNPIQSIGSAQSYGERYTFLANVGLATNEFETDNNVPEKDKNRKVFDKLQEKKEQLPNDKSDGFNSEQQRSFFADWKAADQEVRVKQFNALLKNRPAFKIQNVIKSETNITNDKFDTLPVIGQVEVLWHLSNLKTN